MIAVNKQAIKRASLALGTCLILGTTFKSWAGDDVPLDWGPLEEEIYNEIWGKTLRETEESRKIVQEAKEDPSIPNEKKQEIIQQNSAKVEAGLAQFPQSARLAAEAAGFSYTLGDHQTGMARAERSVSLAETSRNPRQLSAALTVRGRGYSATGDNPRAFADAQAALKADPKNQAAFALAMLTKGKAKVSSPPPGQKTESGQRESKGDTNPPAATATLPDSQALLLSAAQTAKDRAAAALISQAVAAEKIGDHDRAVALAEKALSISPQNPSILQTVSSIKETVTRRHSEEGRESRATSQGTTQGQPRLNPTGSGLPKAEKIGASNFIRGLLHRAGGSGAPLWIDFTEVDTSGVPVSRFPAVAAQLKESARDAQVHIQSEMSWQTQGSQGLLIGGIRLRLKGMLTLRRDCTWSFQGSLSARNDVYDFNKGKRPFIAETLTTLGRSIPGEDFDIEFRGDKRISDAGTKETCP
ncbi:MAG: lipid II-degrading bacteriocin [Elusimicrobia bacterium]|nr:lipid II-degrading bacteriocin [Elusimicrobiota bacterium]